MPLPAYKNRVGNLVSGTPGTGTITLSTADTAHQTFATAYGANANVDILIEDGDAWEIARDCTYTHSGTTVTRGTLEASSTGSALSLTSAAKVYVIEPAARIGGNATAAQDYISGLIVSWSSATQIKVSPGNAYIQKSGTIVNLAAESTINPTLSASTWHYVYLKEDGTCEVSTTAPASAYAGSARSKNTSGSEFRLIGQFSTDSSSNIYKFKYSQSTNAWLYHLAGATNIYRVLSNGQATSSTTVSLAAFVPPQSTSAYIKASNTDATLAYMVADGDTTADGTTAVGFFSVTAGVRASFECPLNSSQQLAYDFPSAPTGGAFIDMLAYYLRR